MRFPLLTVVAFACAGGTSTAVGSTVLTGSWGGEHIALVFSDSGAALEYDCAHGGISAPVRTRDGRFDVAGVHVREHGGPMREGERPDSVPARYIGSVRGDRLTLLVIAGADSLGTFELQRGAAPRIFRCL